MIYVSFFKNGNLLQSIHIARCSSSLFILSLIWSIVILLILAVIAHNYFMLTMYLTIFWTLFILFNLHKYFYLHFANEETKT